jgi:peptidyl-prolyl cis-trans isomerase D
MLTALRRLASTWVAKALFVLLVVSFGIWGIGDTVRNLGRDTALARVNGQPIEMEEAQAALRREMQRLSRTVGSRFENDPRVRRAMAEQAVDGLVLDRVLRDETARLGVAVPDAVVREFVFSLPGFRGPAGGGFSRAAFESFLRENGLTERDFLSLARADIARQQVSTAVRAGAAAPSVLARRLLQWRDQQRAATVVSLPLSAAPEPAAPSEAALRRFHENNPRLFSSPEYRDAAVAVLTAEILGREVEVSDAEIAAAFEQRRGSFETPERRTVEQVLLADEAAARRVFEELSAEPEMPFADVVARAEAAGGQATQLGAVDRAGLPVPELAEAAFSLAPGSISAPVRSPFGWHVLRVTGVEPGRSRPLEAVRDELRAALAQERAADLAFERANKVEDALAGGATLEEAAKRFGLGFAAIRTDASGKAPDGERVELPVIEDAREPLLRAVFEAEQGAAPRLKETEAGFVAVELREAAPPALRPFESVEAEVRAAWEADARRRAQEERAAALLAATRAGKSLAEAAREAGLGSREVGALTRAPGREGEAPGGGGAVPPELLAPLFELRPGEATMVPTGDGFAVAQLLEVTEPDPESDPAALARVRDEAGRAIATDLEAQFIAALRARADVRINPRLMDSLSQP